VQSVLYIKRLLPISLKRFVKIALTRSVSVTASLWTNASRMGTRVEEAATVNTALAELVHRTDYLKSKIEHIEARLRDLSDDLETLISLNSKVTALEIELANCRNLAEVSLQAAEALQLGRARTGT
jgi:prefoldin subunit 5